MPRAEYHAHGPRQEARRGGPLLVRKDLGVGEPGVIIDGDVDVFPADAAPPLPAVPVDAVPDAADPPQLLDVEVDQLPGPGVLIAHDRSWGLQPVQPIEPQTAELRHHGRDREPVVLGDAATAPALPPAPQDLAPSVPRQALRRVVRPGRAVAQCGRGFGAGRLGLRRPAEPLVDGLAGDAYPPGDLRNHLARLHSRRRL